MISLCLEVVNLGNFDGIGVGTAVWSDGVWRQIFDINSVLDYKRVVRCTGYVGYLDLERERVLAFFACYLTKNICICIYKYINTNMYIYVYIHVCIYICMHVHVHM